MSYTLLRQKKAVWFAVALVVLLLVVVVFNRSDLPALEPTRDHIVHELPDFSRYQLVDEKKTAFFTFLYPIVEQENRHLAELRKHLLAIQDKETWNSSEERWLEDLAERYIKDWQGELDDETLELLVRRVDIIPPSLVLAQAAIESAWGTSRFAREGNNLFGQWCFSAGCGLVPKQRGDGKTHEVATFDSVNDSVQAYLDNLNAFRAYRSLRTLRLGIREEDAPLSGTQLLTGLSQYSEQGSDYLKKVERVISQNGLSKFDERQREALIAKS